MSRPRLLFLCQTLPYPPDGGVWIRTYHVLRLLARAFDITALCFERAGSAGLTNDHDACRKALSQFAEVEIFSIPQKHSRRRFDWDHLRSDTCRRVYTSYLYQSRTFRRRLQELLQSTRFDLVHVDSLDLASYLHLVGDVPTVCVHHDIESNLLRRRAGIDRSWWRGWYLRLQAAFMEETERRWCARIAMNVTVSSHDAALLERLAPLAPTTVVPNGVDAEEFRPVATDGRGVAYVGGTNPFPNLDALNFFCEEVLPHLGVRVPNVPVRWIGRASSTERKLYQERFGVDVTGYVDDVRPLMAEAACHVVPLRLGGGTRLKILNAWAMGKPVVSTSVGCEGLEAEDGKNILIRNDPRSFADAIAELLSDSALRHTIGKAGRATVERLYSWDAIGDTLIKRYLAVANAGTRSLLPAVALGGHAQYHHT
jgi:glycosyltransferase involved in cell wall biosynthesis